MNGYLSKILLPLFFFPAVALAATEAPHEIAPSITAQPDDGAMDNDTGVGYEEQAPTPINAEPIGKPTTDNFGTLTQDTGGLSADIWQSDNRESDEFLLMQFHTGIANASIRDLLVKLLITQSAPPPGTTSNDWLDLRVNALANIGQDDKANEMINALPASLASDKLFELQTEIMLAHGDYEKACQKAQSDIHKQDSIIPAFWQKLTIACQASGGKTDEAMVGIDMLRETGTDDPFFQETIHHMADKNIQVKSLPTPPSLFDYALIRMTGDANKLGEHMDSLPPIALKYLAQDSAVDAKLREKATTKAEQTGLIPTPDTARMAEQPFAKSLASDVTTLVTALGSGNPATEADNAVIARLALNDAGIQDSRRINKLLSCMEIFGYKVPDAVWNKLLIRKNRFDGETPSAMLLDRLNQAVQANRKAEVILTAALITGSNDAEKVSDLALIPVIKALKSIGFEKQARDLAYAAVQRYK